MTKRFVIATKSKRWDSKTAEEESGISERALQDALRKLRGLAREDISNAAETDPVFSASEAAGFAAGDVAKLGGIDAGAEVNNISDVNATDLTDGGATTLHTHGYQPLDAGLASLSALPTAADKIAYSTATDVWAETAITAAARALLGDATSAAMLATLGIGGLATNITATKTLTLTCADNFNLTVPGTGVALVKSTALTAGYIPFGIAGNLVGEDAGLFWDNVNKRLGVGTTSPGAKLEVASPSSGGVALKVGRVSGQPSIRGISATDWLIVDAGTSGTVGLNY